MTSPAPPAEARLLDATRAGLPLGTVASLVVAAVVAAAPGLVGLYRVGELERAQTRSDALAAQAQAREEKRDERIQGMATRMAVQEERYTQIITGLAELRRVMETRTVYAKGRAE